MKFIELKNLIIKLESSLDKLNVRLHISKRESMDWRVGQKKAALMKHEGTKYRKYRRL